MSGNATEQRLRRILMKHGYDLHKSRSRNWSPNDQLGYMIVNREYNCVAAGGNYDCSLEDVEQFVKVHCND